MKRFEAAARSTLPADAAERIPVGRGAASAMPAWLGAHRSLFLNAGSLFGSTLLTAGLGAIYWAIAARLFPAAAVGLGAAAISTMTLLAQLATFGLGTVLMGELAEHRQSGRRLIASALGVTAASGAGIAIAFLLVASSLVPELSGLRIPTGVVV